MAIGGRLGWVVRQFAAQGGTEPKAVSCVVMQNFGFKTLNCSLHLAPHDFVACGRNYPEDRSTETTRAQAREAHDWTEDMARFFGAHPTVAGDFNIRYCGGPLPDRPHPPGQGSENTRALGRWDHGASGGYPHREAWLVHDVRRETHWHDGRDVQQYQMIDLVWGKRPTFEQHGRYGCTWFGGVGPASTMSDHAMCPAVFLVR
jgi:hypothetical protein